MYDIGSYVQWDANVRGKTYKRAGEVLALVPMGKDPRNYVPTNYVLHIRGKPRNTISYLIKIPGLKTLYWPPLESLLPLPMVDWELLYSQQIYMKPRKLEGIDQSDRNVLKALCELLGDKYYENVKMITIPAWGKRFYFKTVRKLECIYKIEEFISAIRGY